MHHLLLSEHWFAHGRCRVIPKANSSACHVPSPRLGQGSLEMAKATGFGAMTEDPDLDDNLCVFGNSLMKGLVLACDYENARLG